MEIDQIKDNLDFILEVLFSSSHFPTSMSQLYPWGISSIISARNICMPIPYQFETIKKIEENIRKKLDHSYNVTLQYHLFTLIN